MSCIINPYIFATGTLAGTPPTWTGVTGATNSSGLLTKTAGSGWGNCGAVSNETQAGDFRFAMWRADFTGNDPFVGVGPDSSCNTYSTVDFAFHLNQHENALWESGSYSGLSQFFTVGGSIMLVIERIGSTLKYYYLFYSGARPLPDDAGRTLWRTDAGVSTATFYINVALENTGNTFDASWIEWGSL
jgi:hypothetical protein